MQKPRSIVLAIAACGCIALLLGIRSSALAATNAQSRDTVDHPPVADSVKEDDESRNVLSNSLTPRKMTTTFDSGATKLSYMILVDGDGHQTKQGEFVEYYEDGQPFRRGQHLDDQRTGTWEYFDHEGRTVKVGEYAAGRPHGAWTFLENGQRTLVEHYRHGVRHGRWVTYDSDTGIELEVREFADGKRHGMLLRKYPNGQPKRQATFEHGKLHGTRTTWHSNGQQAVVEEFVNDQRHGRRSVWEASGKLQLEELYERGQRVTAE